MKKVIYLLIGCIGGTIVHAQSITPSILNAGGGTAVVNGYICDWSFTELILATTYSTPNLIVTQGVLQNDPYIDPNGIKPIASLKQNIKVYPNPSKDIIYLQSEDKSETKYQYSLLDIGGKTILNKSADFSLNEKTQTVDLSKLPAGTYILKITELKKEKTLTQSYKIQKIN